jgi:hypothetical protein
MSADLNRVAVVGSTTVFNCSRGTPDGNFLVDWDRFLHTSVFSKVSGNPSMSPRLQINKSADEQSEQLTLRNVQISDAGAYVCMLQDCLDDVCNAATHLIVIGANEPECWTNITVDAYATSVYVETICMLNYGGNYIPSLQCLSSTVEWSTNSREFVSVAVTNRTDSQLITFRRDFIQTSAKLHRSRHDCSVSFIGTNHFIITVYASNIATYNFTWFSPTVTVSRETKTSIFSANNTYLKQGDILTCSFDGFPTWDVHWLDWLTGTTTTGANYVINVCAMLDMVDNESSNALVTLTCRANITVDGKVHSSRTNVMFSIAREENWKNICGIRDTPGYVYVLIAVTCVVLLVIILITVFVKLSFSKRFHCGIRNVAQSADWPVASRDVESSAINVTDQTEVPPITNIISSNSNASSSEQVEETTTPTVAVAVRGDGSTTTVYAELAVVVRSAEQRCRALQQQQQQQLTAAVYASIDPTLVLPHLYDVINRPGRQLTDRGVFTASLIVDSATS